MSKLATNRANIRYATELKRRGFPTAIHALPKEAKDYVDELLEKGWSLRAVASEVMKRYGEQLPTYGLRQLTYMSVKSYRDGYWKDTLQFRKMVLQGSEASREATKEVMKDFHAMEEMVGVAKNFRDNRLSKIKTMEEKLPVPTRRGDETYEKYFKMCNGVLRAQMDLGLIERAPVMIGKVEKTEIELTEGLSTKELILTVEKAIAALRKKGKYAKRKLTGEKL